MTKLRLPIEPETAWILEENPGSAELCHWANSLRPEYADKVARDLTVLRERCERVQYALGLARKDNEEVL